jgi:MerR family transcriptional regulator, light-induced transcriptional regulator
MSNWRAYAGKTLQNDRAAIVDALAAVQSLRGLAGIPGEIALTMDQRSLGIEPVLALLAEALLAGEPAILLAHLRWAKAALSNRGSDPGALRENLILLRAVLEATLPAQASAAACDYLDQGQEAIAAAPAQPPCFLKDNAPLRDLAADYLGAILEGDRRRGAELIFSAVDAGTTIQEIYSRVFEPVQREIGRLWQCNRISVAHEHYCSAATQLIMSQLYPRIIQERKNGRSAVVACVNGDLHEIGAHMVADFLELDGWDVHYLGASMPTTDVIRIVEERQSLILCISATMSHHIPVARELIGKMRDSNKHAGVRILAGGYAFTVAPSLVRAIGADAGSADAAGAVAIANSWMQT